MMDTSSAGLLTIDVQEILHFFDEKPKWSIKQATAMVGVFGEDLNAACFRRYIKSQGARATVRPDPVTTGKRKGPQLDRWIVVGWPDGSETVFQTEIKNWSSHAVDGKTLPIRANAKDIADHKQKRWELRWDSQIHTLKRDDIAKVLVPMKLPSDLEGHAKDVRPLLIFWEPTGPREKAHEHLFRIDSPTYDFPFKIPPAWPNPPYDEFRSLWVFSVSSYLRSIPDASIKLEMPDAYHRLRILGRLLPEFRSHR